VNQETKMTFLQHFGILRKSFIKIILLIIILFIPAFIFRDLLMDFALMPMSQSLPPDSNIIFTKPAEGLASNIKVAFLSSFIATMPLIIYEAWSFVKPALYENEKIVSLVIIVIGSLLFFVGASFCFFFVAPLAFDVLINEYSSESITALPNISDTLGFLTSLILSFGIIFEYPLIIFLLSRFGLASSSFLSSKRKYAILIACILSAILTPTTDVISMMFMLLPLLLFYEIGVLIAFLSRKDD
jgi:sec-independent protein translocase protein TatC|tara:strand:- start:4422 stop:5150 length:729 start_codon:yes stop_codon:yes gene_type:complete